MFGSLLAGLLITVWPVMLYWNMFGSLLLGRHVGPRVGLIVVCCILAIIEDVFLGGPTSTFEL